MPSTRPTRTDPRPRLGEHLRLDHDRVRDRDVLQGPETVVVLNPTGAAILRLCDGRTLEEILAALRERYGEVPADDVRGFLDRLAARGMVVMGP